MRRIGPTRIYLQTAPSHVSRFLWFHNQKPNEMLMGINGLTQTQSDLISMYPEQIVTQAESESVTFLYSQAQQVGKAIDHITCHADGTFQIRTIRDKELYLHRMKRAEPLGPNTPIFLEFIIVSDLAQNYSLLLPAPKKPAVILGVHPKAIVNIRGMLSGARYDLEGIMIATVQKIAKGQPKADMLIRLNGTTLKGMLFYETRIVPTEILRGRPSGTIVSFKFPISDDRRLIKTFLFA